MLGIHGSVPLLLVSSFFSFIICIHSQKPVFIYPSCSGSAEDPMNSTLGSNLEALLSLLASKATLDSFHNDTSNGIYALYLCRGDVSMDTCQACVHDATQRIRKECSSNKTAIVWYDQCLLRYSDSNFFGVPSTKPMILMWNTGNSTSAAEESNIDALSLLYPLMIKAISAETLFSTDQIPVKNGAEHRFGLEQCTRDITSDDCRKCLNQLVESYRGCDRCKGSQGWRFLAPSCFMRYESYIFYQQQSPPSPTPVQSPPTAPDVTGGNNTAKAAVIAVASVAGVAALLGFWYCCFFSRRRKKGGEKSQEILSSHLEGSASSTVDLTERRFHHLGDQDTGEMHYFDLNAIKIATDDFSKSNKLGEGGFGPVYKGKLIDGREIAVKRLSMRSSQGLEEFKNEVLLIVKLQHRNLVRLLGCCLEENEKLLVYEYMANTSLEAFLFDPKKSQGLDWEKRANIINGTAKGILYLHEDSRLKIIHRDLKASNILLDDDLNPKISDFGTARILGGNQIEANTARVVGTYGYMAPEYALEGLFSVKSDVYSFGILMLEIISGKKNSSFNQQDRPFSLILHAWELWNEGKGHELIDQNIVDACPVAEAVRWIHIALLCIQEDPNSRPSMSTVVLMLGSKSMDLPQPSTSPFSVAKYIVSDGSTSTGAGTGLLMSDNYSSTNSSS